MKTLALVAALLFCALLSEPLFVVLGVLTILCFLLFAGDTVTSFQSFTVVVERIQSLADNQSLLAIPLFVLSGGIMSEGEISKRLVAFTKALVGWLPGGLAVGAVLACCIFAAISGSSPATVVAIGGMMYPALMAERYREDFSVGLLTSAGSLGILIPPSIPMIVYAIVNQTNQIQVEALFLCGIGPGLLIGLALSGYSVFVGARDRTPRQPFRWAELGRATRDGFWALLFPVTILGGIYFGIFNAIESAGISVVYALVVEVFFHRAVNVRALPKVFAESALLLGSLLVVMVVALSFAEFLALEKIPEAATAAIQAMHLTPLTFLLLLNLLLLVIGCLMDIMSAIFMFVPLLAPIATAIGIDPLHLAIIFIVNLEIGYLTPPVGLNLFVASTLFKQPLGFVIRSVVPFILIMLVCLGVITYVPSLSVGLSRAMLGGPPAVAPAAAPGAPARPGAAPPAGSAVQSIEEMMREAAQQRPPSSPPDAGTTP